MMPVGWVMSFLKVKLSSMTGDLRLVPTLTTRGPPTESLALKLAE